MAQLDVYRTSRGELLLDFQSDTLDYLNTRFVIPMLPPGEGPKPAERLNPQFEIDAEPMILYPQFALTVPRAELQHRVVTLADEHFTVLAAVDMLISGY